MIVWLFLMAFNLNCVVVFADTPNSTVDCKIYRANLAHALSSFTSCAISYSHPITFCEACVDIYIAVLNSYKNLSEFKNENGPCIDSYVNLDRLQIVQTLYDNSFDLWNRAKCYECFQVINGTLTNKFSAETTTFNDFFANFTDCKNRTGGNQTNLCSKCMDAYNSLNNYYISISNENENIGVCMDIVDLMNGTRGYWSRECCKYRRKDETVFIIATITVIVITLLFYIATKLCSEKKIPIILKQTRFAGSFNQVFN